MLKKRLKSSRTAYAGLCDDVICEFLSFCDLTICCTVRLVSRRWANLIQLCHHSPGPRVLLGLLNAWERLKARTAGAILPTPPFSKSSLRQDPRWVAIHELKRPFLIANFGRDLLAWHLRNSCFIDDRDRWRSILLPSIQVQRIHLRRLFVPDNDLAFVALICDCELQFTFGELCEIHASCWTSEEGYPEYPHKLTIHAQAPGREDFSLVESTIFDVPIGRGRRGRLPSVVPRCFTNAFWDLLGVKEFRLAWWILNFFREAFPEIHTRKCREKMVSLEPFRRYSPEELQRDERFCHCLEEIASVMPEIDTMPPMKEDELPFHRIPSGGALREVENRYVVRSIIQDWFLRHLAHFAESLDPASAVKWKTRLIPSVRVLRFHKGVAEGADSYLIAEAEMTFSFQNLCTVTVVAWARERFRFSERFETDPYVFQIHVVDRNGKACPSFVSESRRLV